VAVPGLPGRVRLRGSALCRPMRIACTARVEAGSLRVWRPRGEQCYRLVTPARFRGTSLYHRQLGGILTGEEHVEITFRGWEDQHINLSSCK
jgi:hypothetical protein